MSPKLILGFLKIATTVLFYLLILITLFILVTAVMEMFGGNNQASKLTRRTYNYEVQGFGLNKSSAELPFSYSKDSLIGFKEVKDRYKLRIEPRSAMGYYALVSQLIFLGLSIGVLWTFMKLFKQTKLENPFTSSTVKRLKTLAALFIISDILGLINYFFFSIFLAKAFTSIQVHFELITTVGSEFITGLIIWIIAVIFQRGINLQEENALTV